MRNDDKKDEFVYIIEHSSNNSNILEQQLHNLRLIE